MKHIIFGVQLFVLISCGYAETIVSLGRTNVNEWFSKQIVPSMFNLTLEQSDQFEFEFSLRGYPNLPSWIQFMYSTEYNAGYLYGTPPDKVAGHEVQFDMIALNKRNYAITHVILSLYIVHKTSYALSTVEMKIDNLNWIHLTDPGRVENMKNIFRMDLWPESKNDLHISFMESAVKMGGRVPLQPNQKEGVIVHLSSHTAFSQRLIDLHDEVKPLYKLQSCTYKRTSVQMLFESAGFKLDWCAYRMFTIESQAEAKKRLNNNHVPLRDKMPVWNSMSLDEVPQRSYVDEMAYCLAIPSVMLTVLIAILSLVLCFQHKKLMPTPNHAKGQTVQIVQYADNQPTTSLKRINDVNAFIDNLSILSNSPNNTLTRNNNIIVGTTMRPKPPPYKPKNFQRSGVNI